MNKQTSIYLDLIRFLAALAVFIWHIDSNQFYNLIPDWSNIGHDAVIVFFVLSGYVIFSVSHTRTQNIKDFFINRLARLYSVLIPALFLSFLITGIGYSLNPELYEGHLFNNAPLFKIFSILTFTHQIWGLGVRYFTNTPLWSLSYEFWYYVLFAFAFFIKDKKLKYALISATCLLIGHKILLLLPVWLLGVLIYKLHQKINITQNKATCLFVLSFLLYAVYFYVFHYLLSNPGFESNYLGYSTWFGSDIILGLIVAVNIFSVKYLRLDCLSKYEKSIRECASITFSMYLFHKPLLFFYGAVFKHSHEQNNFSTFILLTIFTLMTIIILAQFTEKKKHVFKRAITYIWDREYLKFFVNKEPQISEQSLKI